MEIKLRQAGPQDIREIYKIMEALVEELREEVAGVSDVSGFMTLDPYRTLQGIQDCVFRSYAVVAESGDKIIGSMGVGTQTHWFTNTQHLWNCWFFVYPEYRNSPAAAMMLRDVKKFAEAAKMPLIMGISTLKDVDRKNRLFSRYFRPIGGWFIQGVKEK